MITIKKFITKLNELTSFDIIFILWCYAALFLFGLPLLNMYINGDITW